VDGAVTPDAALTLALADDAGEAGEAGEVGEVGEVGRVLLVLGLRAHGGEGTSLDGGLGRVEVNLPLCSVCL